MAQAVTTIGRMARRIERKRFIKTNLGMPTRPECFAINPLPFIFRACVVGIMSQRGFGGWHKGFQQFEEQRPLPSNAIVLPLSGTCTGTVTAF